MKSLVLRSAARMIAWFGAAENFFVQGIAYSGVLAMIYLMHIPPHRADANRATAFANLKEGVRLRWSTPAVLALMMLAYVPRVFAVPYQTLMPVFSERRAACRTRRIGSY